MAASEGERVVNVPTIRRSPRSKAKSASASALVEELYMAPGGKSATLPSKAKCATLGAGSGVGASGWSTLSNKQRRASAGDAYEDLHSGMKSCECLIKFVVLDLVDLRQVPIHALFTTIMLITIDSVTDCYNRSS